jgi:mannosyltransferase OCH1-like enzyme
MVGANVAGLRSDTVLRYFRDLGHPQHTIPGNWPELDGACMRIGLHVGLTTVGNDVLGVLAANQQTLADHDWTVAPEEHDFLPPEQEPKNLVRLVTQTTDCWSSWLPSVNAAGAVMSCVHLGDALLVGGQANEIVAQLEKYGEVSGGALVRRIDDYIATRYVLELFAGRVRRLSDREMSGRGPNNYFPRISRWQSACGPSFRAVLCPSGGPDGDSVVELLHVLGLPDSLQLDLPDSPAIKSVGAVEAEVLRQFNRLMQNNGLSEPQAQTVRTSAIARLTAVPSPHPFAIPTDAANNLLSTYEESATALSQSMTSDHAKAFLSRDLPLDVAVDEPEVQGHLESLAAEFELAMHAKQSKSPGDQALMDVRRLVRKARASRLEEDAEEYLRCRRRVCRRLIPELSEFRAEGVGQQAAAAIPDRVLQYWDPSPPPEEMLPWMQSWATVGMPVGTHEVADYDRGLAAVVEAAGDLGRRAFEASTHPAVRSDLFRYAELYLRGGWYVDAEHEALVSINDFFPWKVEHVFVIRPNTEKFPNGFVGAVAGSPLMKDALDQACRNILDGVEISIMDLSGPWMFSRLVHEYMKSPTASFVVLPTNVVFGGVMQRTHNEAEYKSHGHWRHADL